uniref:Uncharacterized protein n=1 Tax=Arundo donax TaxID=35708 RepID=A0A0A8Z0B9_ARUDO
MLSHTNSTALLFARHPPLSHPQLSSNAPAPMAPWLNGDLFFT